MQVPVCSRHRLQDRAQRLAGMWETLVMGSIFSGQPILTWRDTGQGDMRMCVCVRPDATFLVTLFKAEKKKDKLSDNNT